MNRTRMRSKVERLPKLKSNQRTTTVISDEELTKVVPKERIPCISITGRDENMLGLDTFETVARDRKEKSRVSRSADSEDITLKMRIRREPLTAITISGDKAVTGGAKFN